MQLSIDAATRRGGDGQVVDLPAPDGAASTDGMPDSGVAQYVLSPLAKVTRLHELGDLVLHSGAGADRCHLALGGESSAALVAWLFRRSTPAPAAELVPALARELSLSDGEAASLCGHLIDARVLVHRDEAAAIRARLLPWHDYGWLEAGHFHLATFDLPFDPDELNGMSYPEYYARMLENTDDPAGPQPPAAELVDEAAVVGPAAPTMETPLTVEEVLGRTSTVNRLGSTPFTIAELLAPIAEAFAVRGRIGGALGEHHRRAYPSGGARHPYELYVVVKDVAAIEPGVYRFDPAGRRLLHVADGPRARRIDEACFGKQGIVTAPAALVLTCRWLRHGWKYRYARTYRMLMLEAGHIVQTLNLALLAADFFSFHCPSIDDDVLRHVVGVDDDCAEGPVYVLGVGRHGYFEERKG